METAHTHERGTLLVLSRFETDVDAWATVGYVGEKDPGHHW